MGQRWFTAVGVGLACALAVSAAGAGQQAGNAPSVAPYQITKSTRTHLRVDIGLNKGDAEPLRQATVITASGSVPATLVGTRRICEWLCGKEDGQECHYEAVLRLSQPVTKPVAVFAGRPAVSAIAAVSSGSARPIGSDSAWISTRPWAWPWAVDNGAYRWKRFDDGVFLTRDWNRDFYSPAINLASCTQHPTNVFTRLSCMDGQAQLLYEGPSPIFFSLADYGDAAAHPLLRLRLGDKEAVLVRLGFKAQVVVGLLVKEAGQWKIEARTAEYALIC